MSDSRVGPKGISGSYGIIAQGELAVGASNVQLSASSVPCALVWIGAPSANHTGGSNTGDILVGKDATTQVLGGITVANTNVQGFFIPIKDANLLYAKGFNAGDVLEYQIWGN